MAEKENQENNREHSSWRPEDADRMEIRSYIRNAQIPENAVWKPAKPKPTIANTGEMTVGVYARVSTKSDEQVSSIENQTRYYTEKVEKTPNWSLRAVYSDEGKSGTSKKRRLAFQQLLDDAKEKKVDLILCASVSRFSRDMAVCMEEVHRLKTQNPSHPVGVYFETESIYTLDEKSDEALALHAMLADWESKNKSRRMVLSYDQRICTGQYQVVDLFGFRHEKGGKLVVVEDEAEVVRFIFFAFACGYSSSEIADILNQKQRKTPSGVGCWTDSKVRCIITNERRWGDLDVRKTFVYDMKEHKSKKNEGERDGLYIPGHHEAIVSPALAKAALLMAGAPQLTSGIPSTCVIQSGALKGFVSVCPAWKAVSSAAYEEICRSVYSKDELEGIVHEAGIFAGVEHSNVRSLALSEYEVPYGAYFIRPGNAVLTFSAQGLKFNASCHMRLDHRRFVEILYHPILEAVIVRACDANAENAFCWEDDGEKMRTSIAAKEFTQIVYERMRWIPEYRFQFRGVLRVRGEKKLLMFYLDEPRILIGKGKRAQIEESLSEEERHSAVRFIPYKVDDIKTEDDIWKSSTVAAYPHEWENCGGMNLTLRKRRDRLLNSLTPDDIAAESVVVTNPIIGSVPGRDELNDMVKKLLAAL